MLARWVGVLAVMAIAGAGVAAGENLVRNGNFAEKAADGKMPAEFKLSGDAEYRYMGDRRRDISGMGVALDSGSDLNGDGARAGVVSQQVTGLDAKAGRWFEFSFRGMPENDFLVEGDNLFMRAEYFSDGGKTAMDGKEKKLYALVEQDRRDLGVNGNRKVGGAAVWRTYVLKFWLPFPQVDTVRLSVGFSHGKGGREGSFFVDEWKLARADGPAAGDKAGAVVAENTGRAEKPRGTLLPLGGRWFYLAKDGETAPPKLFDHTNADRLIYHDDVWGTPFAGMMTAILRAGEMDAAGNVLTQDRLLEDNVTVSFDATAMIIHTKGIPNHPIGMFPENLGGRRGNPSYVQEQNSTYYIPLEPRERPAHFVTTADNSNHALPMGPIGIAANGVVFFNPFDMGNTDATNMMDKCCGHPNQDNLYHYHKYPVCMNSPWADEGKGHSPLIGWAFDGFPLYGPYAKAGVLAKDVKGEYALNEFNGHFDAQRGWHYQVTPGKFPYLIGGYWGTEDPRDKHGPHGGGPGAMGPPGGRRGAGPPPGRPE